MLSLKMTLRNDLINKKEKYKYTESNLIAIDAAVIKAEYIKNGGTKVILLPKYCDLITLVSLDIINLYERYVKYNMDNEDIANYITNKFKTVNNAMVKENTLIINMLNNKKMHLKLKDDIQWIVYLALSILKNDIKTNYSNQELNHFEEVLTQKLLQE